MNTLKNKSIKKSSRKSIKPCRYVVKLSGGCKRNLELKNHLVNLENHVKSL